MFYDEDQTEEEFIENYQKLINSGAAWKLEGSVGRTAMSLIDSGRCMLGEQGWHDAYGNYVPSRTEVVPGTKGSPEFVQGDSSLADRLTQELLDRHVNPSRRTGI